MHDTAYSIDGVEVPRFVYGTAWKEDATQRLTKLALEHGFRGVDTANQRRHYDEAAVGAAVAAAIAKGIVSREGLFLQTKFTFRASQDHRLPYDPAAPIAEQVAQSFASSVEHLRSETIDSYLLHGPSTRSALTAQDWEAWRAMESIHASGRVRWLGVSNFALQQLQDLCRAARAQPRFVQNRCFAVRGWDRQIRKFCAANGVIYQGFSLLTANREALSKPDLVRIAKQHGRTASQIVFRFALEVGIIALTGTTDGNHMRADLEVHNFRLKQEEVEQIERLMVS